ncbi:hypothetical protein DUZ99_09820 [Xylanibacillus composti]|nr:hypothetical protein [Xylanibacillus composti]
MLFVFDYAHTNDGSIIMNDLPEWVWRDDSLLPQRHMLNGLSAHVLNLRQLLEGKEVYKQIGRKPRPKDEDSKNILHRIIAEFN